MTESFLKYLQFEKRLSGHTLKAYTNDLEQFSNFLEGNFPGTNAHRADYNHIRAWIIHLVETDIGPISVNRKIACLRSFFKFLLAREQISRDPLVKIRALKTRKKLPSFVKEVDMENLLIDSNFDKKNHEGIRDKLILELFYATGIRLSELIMLRENQIDLINRTIKVIGKRNKERMIPFPTGFVHTIEAYKIARNNIVSSMDHGYLFVTNKGERCYPMMVYRIVKKYLSMYTSSEKISPHVLRHTYATHLLNKGAEINAVKDLLGHSSLAATQVYTHNTLGKLKKVFDRAHPKA